MDGDGPGSEPDAARPEPGPDLLAGLRAATDEMVADLDRLVAVESPSEDPDACRRCAEAVAGLFEARTGRAAEVLEVNGRPVVWWGPGGVAPRVLLLGHLDTVWPVGTLARWPREAGEGRYSGPGAFDMKAGIVQGIWALRALGDGAARSKVAVLVTSDEEIGSHASRDLIVERATGTRAVLVLEPSVDGDLKTARKGTATYRIDITGRAAHAGLNPGDGINAAVEAAHVILAVDRLGGTSGTTVTPTTTAAGTTTNTVPASATVHVDVRAETVAEQDRVEAALGDLRPRLRGASVTVTRVSRRPPLEAGASAGLFALAVEVAAGLGLGPIGGRAVGGGSDGNFTAAAGIPTLDGLGAVGGGAHAPDEHVVIPAMAERAALVAGLIGRLTGSGG